MAAYSANLVLLLALADDDTSFVDAPERTAMVSLWRAGLPAPSWLSLIEVIDFNADGKPIKRSITLPNWAIELAYYDMTDDQAGLRAHANGLALQGLNVAELDLPKSIQTTGYLLSTVVNNSLEWKSYSRFLDNLTNGGPSERDAYYAVVQFLQRWLGELEYRDALQLVSVASHTFGPTPLDDLVPAIAIFPQLLVDIPILADPSRYNRNWVPVVLLAGEEAQDEPGRELLRSLRQKVVRRFKLREPRYEPSDALTAIRWLWGISSRVTEGDAKH
jgi:hypothetical protein